MAALQWHQDREGRVCFKADCGCPPPPPRLVEWLSSRSHLGVLLLAAAVGLVLLLHG